MKTFNKRRVAAMAILGTALAFTTASADSTVLDFGTHTMTKGQYAWVLPTVPPGQLMNSFDFTFSVMEEGFDPNSLCFMVFTQNATYAWGGAPPPAGENAIYSPLIFPGGSWALNNNGQYQATGVCPPGLIFGGLVFAVMNTGDSPVTLGGSFVANYSAVPGPASLMGLGLLGVAGARRRRL